ncbi:MAG: hypothetical protein J0M28_14385 [Thauera sp.]|nr:hypothetical protein [Thauera sp.]
METLVAALMAVSGVVLIYVAAYRHRWLLAPLWLAWLLRVGLATVHRYIFALPQGGADAKVFDRTGLLWAEHGCFGFFEHFDPSSSYVYSSILATLYSCFGYSPLGAQFLNSALGVVAVALLACATYRLWGVSSAIRAAFVLAAFPSLLVYSAVTLREAFILVLFCAAIYAVVRHGQRKGSTWIFWAVVFMSSAALFHGGMAFGIVGLFLAIAFHAINDSRGNEQARAFKKLLVVGLCALAVALTYFFLDSIFIPKVGNLAALDIELVGSVVESRAEGGAAYLSGLAVSSPIDLVWQAPLRIAYLLFAPFPWNVSSPSHLFGLLDGMIYLFLTIVLFRHRKILLREKSAGLILAILFSLAFVFAFGTSNFGTGMRHRAKFYVALVVLVAPMLGKRRNLIVRRC